MNTFNWGLIGPGSIAHRFAEAVAGLPNARLHTLLGRRSASSEAFVKRWHDPVASPLTVANDLDALLGSPEVHAIYIATPHDSHAQFALRCLAAGKPVLCEKPLTSTHAETVALVRAARDHDVFLMEALWTRFLPIYALIAPWLRDGAVGRVQHIQSSFCFPAPYRPDSRLFDPRRAGGALLDVGIYNLAMTRWVLEQALGECPEPEDIDLHAVLAPTGVEQRVTATLAFPGDVVAQFVCGFDGAALNALVISGSTGVITVPHNFWEGTRALRVQGGTTIAAPEAPLAINGFEGEIVEAMRCIGEGRRESAGMPLAESLALSRWLQALREKLGLRFPFEPPRAEGSDES